MNASEITAFIFLAPIAVLFILIMANLALLIILEIKDNLWRLKK